VVWCCYAMERRIFILMTVILAFAITCTLGSVSHAQPSALINILRQMDRNVCRSLQATCKARSRNHAKKQHVKREAQPAPVLPPKVKKAEPPAETPPKKVEAAVSPPPKKQETTPPLPRLKPLRPVAIIVPTPVVIPKMGTPDVAAPNNPDDTCLQQLRAQGADFTIAADTVESGLCHVYTPVHLRSVTAQKHVVKLPEEPLLNCKYALQLSKWLRESAAPILSAQTNSTVDKISTGPGYQCRGRNGDASAKISEHGYGNAVDISSFHLANGKDIIVQDASNPYAASYAMLHGLRSSACGYFTTVLGPGSNEAHATHFHFDMGTHGKSGNYRICE
jgi:hypothetical protein